MPDKDGNDYRDCEFCNDIVAYGVVQRHMNGKLYHVDCLIQKLKNEIDDLKNPLTGEVIDDSIPNAFKKIRSALRERTRIVNRMLVERPLLNGWYSGTPTGPKHGMYRNTIGLTWGKVEGITAKAVRDAIKELERLTNG